jgi:hypothetical protein
MMEFVRIRYPSLPIETNIWKGHKNKGEVSKNEGGISKMCVSPREK